MTALNAIPNEKLIEQIKTVSRNNKEMVFIHNQDVSLFVEIPSRKFTCKIDLTSPMANSQLTACNLTLQFAEGNLNDYTVMFTPKSKKSFTLQYDVSASTSKKAEEIASREMAMEGVSRSDYKTKAQVKLTSISRSAA